jgi:hypothetical protein
MFDRHELLLIVTTIGNATSSRSEARNVKGMGSKIKGCVQRSPAGRIRQCFALNIAAPRTPDFEQKSFRMRNPSEQNSQIVDRTP